MGNRKDDIATINWQNYQGTSAVFPVCMKSPAVNGRSLRAQMITAKERISDLVIVLCDSLDRHNMSHIENAKSHCMQLGDIWLGGNLNTVKEYFPNVEVLRWENDIRSHATFETRLKQVQDLYNQSPAVRELRDAMSLYYLHSKKKRFESDYKNGMAIDFDINAALQSSADYLDEEFAGDMVYHDLTGGMAHIYWGLYVDDYAIFSRESGRNMPFPQTLPVISERHGPSYAASMLPKTQETKPSIKVNAVGMAA